MKLDLGSGRYPIEEAIHLETDNIYDGVDAIGLSPNLPFKSDTFDTIVASHIIEHIVWWKVDMHLKEWQRILKSGGFLYVQCPDFVKIVNAYYTEDLRYCALNPERLRGIWLNRLLYWWDEDLKDTYTMHKAIYDEEYLYQCLVKAQFRQIERLDISQTPTFDHRYDLLMRARK